MRSLALLFAASSLLAPIFSGCACPKSAHFFPRMQPLFAGLDEAKVRPSAQPALARAKTDFQLARKGQAPRYARRAGSSPHSHTQAYEGSGYRLLVVHESAFYAHRDGPEIVLDESITGGRPYRYSEVDEVVD